MLTRSFSVFPVFLSFPDSWVREQLCGTCKTSEFGVLLRHSTLVLCVNGLRSKKKKNLKKNNSNIGEEVGDKLKTWPPQIHENIHTFRNTIVNFQNKIKKALKESRKGGGEDYQYRNEKSNQDETCQWKVQMLGDKGLISARKSLWIRNSLLR